MAQQEAEPEAIGEEMATPTGRAIKILELVAANGSISIGELISATNIPRPTIQRLVSNLEMVGYLHKQSIRGQYGVGSRFIQTAQNAVAGALTNASSHSLLVELSQQIGESVSLGTLRGGEVYYFDSVVSESPLTFRFQTGQGTPLHCSSSGHLFLADMTDTQLKTYLDTGPWKPVTSATITAPKKLKIVVQSVREQSYATNKSGLVDGVVGIAVPVTGSNGRTLAALSVAAPMSRKAITELEAHLPLLRETSERISKALVPTKSE